MLPQIVTSPREKSSHLMAVQQLDRLVPIIGSRLRETKSSGPLNAMLKLSINAKLLVLEIAAVRVQSLYRKYMARMRVRLIKHHVKLYLEITSDFCARVVEEVVLASDFEVSLGLIKSHRRYQILKAIVETEMLEAIEDIIMEEVQEKSRDVVIETITDVTNYFSSKRPRKEVQKYNIFIALLSDLTDEVADTFMRSVTVEAIQEEVHEFLLDSYAKYIFEWLSNDVIFEFAKPALVDAILSEGYYDKRNFNIVNMVDILRTSGENNTDSIYFPLHTFHQNQLRHGMTGGQVLEVTQVEMDRAISGMAFMNFINVKLNEENVNKMRDSVEVKEEEGEKEGEKVVDNQASSS